MPSILERDPQADAECAPLALTTYPNAVIFTLVAFRYEIEEVSFLMAFDLKEIIAARLGENYQLHERHLNRTLVAAQRVIGFDRVYARAEGAYLYDMDNQPYLDFLSGYSVFNIGRNH